MSKRLAKVFGANACSKYITTSHILIFQFSPDGSRFFFSSKQANALYTCDTTSHSSELVPTFDVGKALSMTPDCQGIYVQEGHLLEHWCLQSGQRVRSTVVTCMHLTNNGKCVAYTSKSAFDFSICVADNRLVLKCVLSGHTSSVYCLHMSSDFLASAAHDQTVRVWRLADGTVLHTIREEEYDNLIVRITNNFLAVSCNHIIKLFSVDTGDFVRALYGHLLTIRELALSPDGRLLASSSYDRSVRVWDVVTNKKSLYLPHNCFALNIAFNPNGKQLISCDLYTLRVWTVCDWSDRNHHLFGKPFKELIFQLMCIKQRLDICENPTVPKLSMAVWLDIFGCLFLKY